MMYFVLISLKSQAPGSSDVLRVTYVSVCMCEHTVNAKMLETVQWT